MELALTDTLAAEVVDEPGALPLLSTTLLELWEGGALTAAAYRETGGVRGSVARLAERRSPASTRTSRQLRGRFCSGSRAATET